jgi:hypothetical protein
MDGLSSKQLDSGVFKSSQTFWEWDADLGNRRLHLIIADF